MITFLTGVPGSGKTYKAVVSIYNNFSNSKNAKPDMKKDYENCYTNINELKYEKLHDTIPLDLDDLKDKLTILHKLYKDKETDDVLIEKCKELGIYRSLFVIDEAHNIFDTNDKILIWWLSYHRHLYHDIFLITQNLSLIFSKYKSFSEYFYKAKSTTVSLNRNTFNYDVYINSRMSMNAKSHTEKIAKNDEVFELYHSGDSVEAPNVLKKFYIFSIVAVLVVFVLFYYLLGSGETKKDSFEEIVTEQILESSISQDGFQDDNSNNYEDKILFILYCTLGSCSNKDINIPSNLLQTYIVKKNLNPVYLNKINDNYFEYYLETDNQFYKYISMKRKNNDSENSSGFDIPFISNSK